MADLYPPTSLSVAQLRGTIGGARRFNRPEVEMRARRDMKELAAASAIRAIAAAQPPLAVSQAQRLAALLMENTIPDADALTWKADAEGSAA